MPSTIYKSIKSTTVKTTQNRIKASFKLAAIANTFKILRKSTRKKPKKHCIPTY